METKISETIEHWIPEVADRVHATKVEEGFLLNYILLHELAEICRDHMRKHSEGDLERVRDIARVVNLLYQEGDRYICNAIENEFLMPFALEESPGSLAMHMELFPICLRTGYLNTIVEQLGTKSKPSA